MNFILNGTKRSSNICYYFVFTDFHSINFRTPNVGLLFMNIHGYTINSKTFVNLAISRKKGDIDVGDGCWRQNVLVTSLNLGDRFQMLVTD